MITGFVLALIVSLVPISAQADVAGVDWEIQTSPADKGWNSVTYGNGLFVAVGGSGVGNRVMTSLDGTTWTLQASAPDRQWLSVTYGNGLFVAVAQSGTDNRVMTSGSLFPTTPVPLAPMWLLGIMAGLLSVLGVRKLRNA